MFAEGNTRKLFCGSLRVLRENFLGIVDLGNSIFTPAELGNENSKKTY